MLGDQLRRNPELLITDPFKVLINVVERKSVYPTVTVPIHSKFGNNSLQYSTFNEQAVSLVNFYVTTDFKKSGQCRTTMSMKTLLYIMTAYSYGFQRDSEIKEIANQRLT